MSITRIIATKTKEDGSVMHEFSLNGFQTFLYLPGGGLPVNLINYGFTGPTMAVFADKKLSEEEVEELAQESGLKEISLHNGTGLIFMNPKGATWSGEKAGAYEALTENLAIAQSNFRDGLAIMKNPAASDEIEFRILGSCVRMYVYGIGTGADYIAAHYLRRMEGKAALGDLGSADLSMVCATLVKGTVLPTPGPNDIHVVSVGNSEEYNNILKANCEEVIVEAEMDFVQDFRKVIGNYRRWNGKVVHAYNYEAEGIVEKAEAVMIPVGDDNWGFRKMPEFARPKEHKVGYVTFYDEKLDVKAGKVPLMLVFHGGGDSAYATASLAEWPEIGQQEGFITVAVEMHMTVSAKEAGFLIDHLLQEYSIDPEKIYATGFSMGGIKCWDLYELCPERFAALLPMNAIDYVGNNCFGEKTEKVNEEILVPLFYIGGVDSFGVELPCHHERAAERLAYVSRVNQFREPYEISFAERENWKDPLYGAEGDRMEVLHDEGFPESVYTVHYFDSKDGNCYTALMGVTKHAHEIRPFTNRFAWNFVKKFRRLKDGKIQIEK